jgi:putative peptidoglycan lipid II flippase
MFATIVEANMSSPQNSAVDTPARVPQISQKMTVGRAALMLALMVALSRLTGFGRLMVTSYLYGVSEKTDAYTAAFNIPDTLNILIAGGALATGFVPVFTQLLSRGETERAQRTFRAMWTLLAAGFAVISLSLLALTFTPYGALLAPQKVSPQTIDLYLHLLRILLVAQFFFVLGGLFSGTLNALRQFWYFALQPVAFNVGIIVGGLIGPQFGMDIESQAWGALAGAMIGSILIQIPAIYRNGLSLRPLWDFKDEGVQRVLKSLLPIVFGLSSGQIIALNLPLFFSAALSEGATTALGNANRLMQVPLAVLASGPAIALFPTISLLAVENNIAEVRTQITNALRRTIVLCFLVTALLMALGLPIVRLLLQHGAFKAEDSIFTASVLACYSLALLPLALQQFLARGFYALDDTKSPVGIGLCAMALFLSASYIATNFLGLGAPFLALASAAAITVLSLWMAFKLRLNLAGWDGGATKRVLAKGFVAALAAFATTWGISQLMLQLPGSIGKIADVLALALGSTCGVAAFLIVGSLLKLQEIEAVTAKLGKLSKLKRKRVGG